MPNVCECVHDNVNHEFYQCRYCKIAALLTQIDARLSEADAAVSEARRLAYLIDLALKPDRTILPKGV